MLHIESLEQFESEVSQFDGVVLVDFYADRCGPCKMLGPTIENLATEFESDESVKIAKIDVDKVPELAGKFGVMSIPTVIVFAKGTEASKNVGVLTIDQLKTMINKAKPEENEEKENEEKENEIKGNEAEETERA